MLWVYVLAGAIGFLLAVRYGVPAVLAASALVVLISIVVTALRAAPIWQGLAIGFGAAVILQCAYLAGLALLWLKVPSKRHGVSMVEHVGPPRRSEIAISTTVEPQAPQRTRGSRLPQLEL